MKIRSARLSDVKEMVALLHQLFEIETDFVIDSCKHQEGLELLIGSSDVTVLVADHDDGKIIGMATMQRIVSTAMGGYAGLIEDVVIDKSYRNQGIGKTLMETLIEIGRSKGYLRLQMAVASDNESAKEFYQGYEFFASKMMMFYKTL